MNVWNTEYIFSDLKGSESCIYLTFVQSSNYQEVIRAFRYWFGHPLASFEK